MVSVCAWSSVSAAPWAGGDPAETDKRPGHAHDRVGMAAREVVEYDAEFSRPSFQRRLVALCFSFFTWFMAWLVVLTVNLNYAVPRLDSPVADFGTFALLW